MEKKINVVGVEPKKIEIVDQPKRRINPAELGAALGADPIAQVAENLDLIALGELGAQLLDRLRSTGGRPGLADATVNCRVPLSADDVQTLESMVSHIGESTGAKPSVGQLASVIVRRYLSDLKNTTGPSATADVPKQVRCSTQPKQPPAHGSSWLDAHGQRQKWRAAQEVVEKAGTTWGRKRVA